MKTMSELQLMRYAYDEILDRWYKESVFNKKIKNEFGTFDPIATRRVELYESQLEELRELIHNEEKLLLVD